MGLRVKVIKTEVVTPKQFCHEHLLPLTSLDLLVPPIDVGAFYCFKKPNNHVDVTTMFNVLKTSLCQTLSLFYPLAGEVVSNEAGEPEIHCNNKGVDFIEAVADVELRELEFYNHDENIGRKLMPKKHHGVLAIQVTMLKCGAMVIASLYDHRVADGYSTNLFATSWANITRCEPPSILPYFFPLNARQPTHYTSPVANMFIPLSNLPSPESDPKLGSDMDLESLTNRMYYIKGDQIKNLQLLSSQNGHRRSKIESFTSFLWKSAASFLEDSGHAGYMCNIAVPIDGRMRLSEGEGVEKQKLLAGRLGNIISMPFKGIQSKHRRILGELVGKMESYIS
ncbi:shikimate O-hydroxycinnamoyltransferase-like protein [Tanacetum coccineum]